MVNPSKIAFVTGGNSGIGFAITKLLCTKGIFTLMGSRSLEKGNNAINELNKQHNISNVKVVQIEITSMDSIKKCYDEINQKYGQLDILVNNAGMAFRGNDLNEEIARTTIGTNYYGTQNVILTFLPLMKENGRIVNVSSMMGRSSLQKMSHEKRKQFLNANLLKEIDSLMEQFINDVKTNTYQQNGWPSTAYGVSKAGVTMMTRVLGNNLVNNDIIKNKHLTITSCCPGYVRTPMTNPNAPKSPEEGAVTPVWLATSDDQAVKHSGGFFEDECQKNYC